MKNIITTLLLLLLTTLAATAQPNCLVYKNEGDMKKYEACEKCSELAGHYQFSKEFQEKLDEVLEIDSTFAWAYRAKSVAYLKSGDFIRWKELMDKAVQYDPENMLGYRGWCRFQFFRDYEGAIADLEELDKLVDYDIGYSVTGEYHLKIAMAICYRSIGEKEKAIKLIEEQIGNEKHFAGLYDYLHLGSLYLEVGEFERSIEALEKQINENDMAEVHYYLGMNYYRMSMVRSDYQRGLAEKEKALNEFIKAKELYTSGKRMRDGYSHPVDKVFLEEIELQIENLESL
ncbi:MAG: hypothetical protein CMP59_11705 [Flavobacteriales bacterium]|nr:hypothetical protein [Flavobacteriales bacterium]|tara:strand:+ start:247 stop:1110 length:864 start_codon:yes stop_codon:yes gene_type:complete